MYIKKLKLDIDHDNRLILLVEKYKEGITNLQEFLIGITGNVEIDCNNV